MNIFSWVWISLFCELIFRIIKGAFNSSNSLKDSTQEDQPDAEDSNIEGKENENVDYEINPRKRKCGRSFFKRCGRGLAGLAEEFKAMSGKGEEKDNNNITEDPLVKDGLRREDKFVHGGNVKISSYYNKDGKLVFHRQTLLKPPSVNDIRNSSQGTNIPPFFIKPQEAASSNGVKDVDDQIDKTFGKIYSVKKELGDTQKNFVDEHVDKTFKDIYDMVVPSVF